MKKILALTLAILMLFSLVACGGEPQTSNPSAPEAQDKGMSESPLPAPQLTVDYEIKDDFKIGYICLHDEKSTYDKNFLDAADEATKALGLSADQVIIKTNIPEGNECYEAAADLVDQGCKVIFANSFGHEDYMLKAAKEFPNVQFCHATGYKAHLENVANYHNAFASIYEGRYLAGIAAGMKLKEMMKADSTIIPKMGYVGAFTYAEVISGYSSFYLGAKSIVPEVTMDVQFTGSWYDAVEEQNAAEALIDRGCVLISQHADSMGAPGACEATGVPNVSYNGSTYESCPETFIVSSRINWAPYFNYIIKCWNTDTAIDTDWCGGIAEGSVVLTGVNEDVAAEGTVDAIKNAIEGLKNGTINVFDTANFTVDGAAFTGDAVVDGIFEESSTQSAPYFDLKIDGINRLNEKF